MTVVNNSAPRTHPNDKLRYIPKSGMSRDHTRTGSPRSRCLGGVVEVRPCEAGWVKIHKGRSFAHHEVSNS
jgi:hypothetical protein